MAHNCKRVQNGRTVCDIHLLTKDGLRYRFKKQIQGAIDPDQLAEWKELMQATMLPKEDSVTPLDDRSQSVIEKVAKGVAI